MHACLQYFSVLKIPVITGTQALLTLTSTLSKLLQLICFHTTLSFLCSPDISAMHSLGFFCSLFCLLFLSSSLKAILSGPGPFYWSYLDYSFICMLWTVLDASSCTLSPIFNKNISLNHALKNSNLHFKYNNQKTAV